MKIFLSVLSILFLLCSPVIANTSGYEDAFALYKKGDYRKAIKYLKEYVALKPDPRAYYLLGYACYKLKQNSESVRYFKEAYVLDPNISPAILKK